MRVAEKEREARFDALFAAYLADITAYCRWRAPSVADTQDSVSPEADAVRVALGRMAAANQEVLLLAEWEGLRPPPRSARCSGARSRLAAAMQAY